MTNTNILPTRKIDLHVHSTFSDGTCTPTQLVELAVEAQLAAIAITDHDTTAGIPEAIAAAKGLPLEIIAGAEFSCEYHSREIHILGLCLNYLDPALITHLKAFQESRDTRNQKIAALLAGEGFDITYEKLLLENPDAVITRANIARYLVAHGYVKDIATAFSKYLGDDCRCYVPREKISPSEAVRLIHAAGGLAFLAHPLLYHMNLGSLRSFLDELTADGLDGIEAIYTTHQPGDERNMKRLAADYRLLISGGSDFHGANKPRIRLGTGMGRLYVPYEVLSEICQRKNKLQD